jgi:hypothetical protein
MIVTLPVSFEVGRSQCLRGIDGWRRLPVKGLVEVPVFHPAESEIVKMMCREAVEIGRVGIGATHLPSDGDDANGSGAGQGGKREAAGAVEHLWSPRFDDRSMPPVPASGLWRKPEES